MSIRAIAGLVVVALLTVYFSAIGYAIARGEIPIVLLSLGMALVTIYIIGDAREKRLIDAMFRKRD
jgi:hypothetical protein